MSGNKKKPFLCWDSCLFLGWFNREADKPLAEIETYLRELEKGELRLLVSAISFAEVLNQAGRSDAGTQFREFVKRDNVVRASADFRVAELAATFRERAVEALARGEISTGIKAPDALIAATAVIYRADVLHTFDVNFLPFSNSPIVDGLRLDRPEIDFGPLFSGSGKRG